MWVTVFCNGEVSEGTAAAVREETARQILQPAWQSLNVQKPAATNLKVISLLFYPSFAHSSESKGDCDNLCRTCGAMHVSY